jgi:hypothetical protein
VIGAVRNRPVKEPQYRIGDLMDKLSSGNWTIVGVLQEKTIKLLKLFTVRLARLLLHVRK